MGDGEEGGDRNARLRESGAGGGTVKSPGRAFCQQNGSHLQAVKLSNDLHVKILGCYFSPDGSFINIKSTHIIQSATKFVSDLQSSSLVERLMSAPCRGEMTTSQPFPERTWAFAAGSCELAGPSLSL